MDFHRLALVSAEQFDKPLDFDALLFIYASNYRNRGFKKGPHVVVIYKGEHGYGFTLRHFIVYPPDTLLEALERKKLWQKLTNAQSGPAASVGVGVGGAAAGDPRRRSLTYAVVDGAGHDVLDSDLLRSGASTPGSGCRDPELEPMDTIFVKSVQEGGPAHLAGLLKGDRLLSVNGEWIQGRSYAKVIQLIQRSPPTLTLVVVPEEDDVLQQIPAADVLGRAEPLWRPHRRRDSDRDIMESSGKEDHNPNAGRPTRQNKRLPKKLSDYVLAGSLGRGKMSRNQL